MKLFSKIYSILKINENAYRFAVIVALAAAFFLIWVILAVGVLGRAGESVDLMYISVFVVGIIGAFIVRLQAKGLERVLFAMALTQMLIIVIALIAGIQHTEVNSVLEILGLNGFFVVLFVVSAMLFRTAALDGPTVETG